MHDILDSKIRFGCLIRARSTWVCNFWGHAIQWVLRDLAVERWLVKFVRSMYRNARNRVRVNRIFSDNLQIQVGFYQDSILSPLLFIIVLEALFKMLGHDVQKNCSILRTWHKLLKHLRA